MVGPYAGGWQTNAMKNRLGMLLPDTLHVSPEEAAVCAQEMNHHLHQADCVQHLQGKNAIDYFKMALLADMEQGCHVNRGDGNKHKRRQNNKESEPRQCLAAFFGKPTTQAGQTTAQNDRKKRDGD